MGRKCTKKILPLCRRRLSRKKTFVLRRRRLREMQEQLKNNMQITLITTNPSNSIDSQTFNQLIIPDNITDSNVDNEIHRFGETKEEKLDNEEFETYEENGVYNLNIKYFEDNKDEEDETLISEKSDFLLDAMCMQENIPEGRCIIDISFVWNEIHRVFDNHNPGIACQFKDWKLVNSRRHGLLTQFFFKCRMCNHAANIWSERVESETLDINTSAVDATLKAGISFSQLDNLCSAMNISCMSEETYRKNQKKLSENYKKSAIQNMKQESF